MLAIRSLFARLRGRPLTAPAPTPEAVQTWVNRAVWGVWFGMFAWLAVFLVKHGHNLPVSDEWAFVPLYYSGWQAKLAWLFERHCEHHFILGRAVFLSLLWVTGIDFRAGMWATAVFLAAASAVLIHAARKLRGRTHPVDVVFPLLLLHIGHIENLLLGYQLVFTMTVLFLALFALLVAHSVDTPPGKLALLGSALLLPIALGGGQGMMFTPLIGCWVVWHLVRAVRAGDSRRAGGTAVFLALIAAYTAWVALGQLGRSTDGAIRNGPWETLRHAVQAIGIGVGPLGMHETPWVGWVLLVAWIGTGIALLVRAVRNPADRPVTLGLLAILGGVFAFALAVGHARDSGWCGRFAAFTALAPAVAVLALARYGGPVRRHGIWVGSLLVLGVAATAGNAYHANQNAVTITALYRSFKADTKAGIPIDVLAARNARNWHGNREGWLTLWRNNFSPLVGVPGPYTGTPVAATFAPADFPDPNPTLGRKSYAVAIPARQEVMAVRVEFRPGVWSVWEPMHLAWGDPETGKEKISAAAPWVRPEANPTAVTFIVRGPFANGRLFIGRADCPIRVVKVEALPPQP